LRFLGCCNRLNSSSDGSASGSARTTQLPTSNRGPHIAHALILSSKKDISLSLFMSGHPPNPVLATVHEIQWESKYFFEVSQRVHRRGSPRPSNDRVIDRASPNNFLQGDRDAGRRASSLRRGPPTSNGASLARESAPFPPPLAFPIPSSFALDVGHIAYPAYALAANYVYSQHRKYMYLSFRKKRYSTYRVYVLL